MPTVLRIGPYRFQFFSADFSEPPHVHVKRDRCHAKFWLTRKVEKEFSRGFAEHEVNAIAKLVAENRLFLLRKWDEYFNA